MLSFTSVEELELKVNGEIRRAMVRPADILLDTLREGLGLTGAKPGCENGDCGACTVMVDGIPQKSCLMLTAEALGRDIVTVEGLDRSPMQQAFVEEFAFQCGYCTPGFLMVAHALAQQHPGADENTMVEWLRSNICRCTGLNEIRDAVKKALESAAGTGAYGAAGGTE